MAVKVAPPCVKLQLLSKRIRPELVRVPPVPSNAEPIMIPLTPALNVPPLSVNEPVRVKVPDNVTLPALCVMFASTAPPCVKVPVPLIVNVPVDVKVAPAGPVNTPAVMLVIETTPDPAV